MPILEDDIPALKEGQRVDEWWIGVIKHFGLHYLGQVVKAVLCIFHGPVVESSFNIMGDVIDSRSGRMSMATFNAYHTARFALAATGKSATAHFRRNNVMRDPVNKSLINNIANSCDAYHKVLKDQKDEKKRKLVIFNKQQAKVATKRKAVEALKNDAKRACLQHFKRQARSCKKAM